MLGEGVGREGTRGDGVAVVFLRFGAEAAGADMAERELVLAWLVWRQVVARETSERRSSGPPSYGFGRPSAPLSHRRAPGRRHRRAHTGVCYQEARCIQVETVAMLSHCDTEYGYPAATVVQL